MRIAQRYETVKVSKIQRIGKAILSRIFKSRQLFVCDKPFLVEKALAPSFFTHILHFLGRFLNAGRNDP